MLNINGSYIEYLYTIYIILYIEIHMKNKARVIYPDIPSAKLYVPHNDIPIPIPPDNINSSSKSDEENEINDDLSQEYIPHENKRNLEPFNQHDINELQKTRIFSIMWV